MAESESESFEAGLRSNKMWLDLGEMLAGSLEGIVLNEQDAVKAVKWATCAEACFWKATGEADCHDVKDVLIPAAASTI